MHIVLLVCLKKRVSLFSLGMLLVLLKKALERVMNFLMALMSVKTCLRFSRSVILLK